jgi:predicted anti-sigma-YlaC factor YlaD
MIEVLSAYLEGSLTPAEQETVEHHLVTCRRCREIVKRALPPESPDHEPD